MTRTIKLAVAAAMALGTTSAFATNGDNLIGLGAKSRAMGGTGVAAFYGAESALTNPALLTNVKGTQMSFGGTIFMPNVKNSASMTVPNPQFDQTQPPSDTNPMYMTMEGEDTSDANMNVIPEVSIAGHITDSVVLGIGMFGSAGMGVDYREGDKNPMAFRMATNLQLMKMAPSVAWEPISGLSIGAAAVLQYGLLSISYDPTYNPYDPTSSKDVHNVGNGSSQDFGLGFELGIAYKLESLGLTFGADYKSAIDMEYKNQISTASKDFGINPDATGVPQGFGDNLQQPAEFGLGVAYTLDTLLVTADYRHIAWSSAKGYEDFEWKDQDVIAVGAAYGIGALTLRIGYNYANSPIDELDAKSAFNADGSMNMEAIKNGTINQFNALGFPATTTSHVTAGVTYDITKQTSIDFGIAYAPEVADSFNTTAMTQAMVAKRMQDQGVPPAQIGQIVQGVKSETETKHSQTSVAVALNFAF